MGNGPQSRLINQFTCLTTDPIGLVIDSKQCLFQVIDELNLPRSKLSHLLQLHRRTSIFNGKTPFADIVFSMFIFTSNRALQVLKFLSSYLQPAMDDFPKLLEFCIAVSVGYMFLIQLAFFSFRRLLLACFLRLRFLSSHNLSIHYLR